VAAAQPEQPASRAARLAAQPHLPLAVTQAQVAPPTVSAAAQPAAQSRSRAVLRWSWLVAVSRELWEE